MELAEKIDEQLNKFLSDNNDLLQRASSDDTEAYDLVMTSLAKLSLRFGKASLSATPVVPAPPQPQFKDGIFDRNKIAFGFEIDDILISNSNKPYVVDRMIKIYDSGDYEVELLEDGDPNISRRFGLGELNEYISTGEYKVIKHKVGDIFYDREQDGIYQITSVGIDIEAKSFLDTAIKIYLPDFKNGLNTRRYEFISYREGDYFYFVNDNKDVRLISVEEIDFENNRVKWRRINSVTNDFIMGFEQFVNDHDIRRLNIRQGDRFVFTNSVNHKTLWTLDSIQNDEIHLINGINGIKDVVSATTFVEQLGNKTLVRVPFYDGDFISVLNEDMSLNAIYDVVHIGVIQNSWVVTVKDLQGMTATKSIFELVDIYLEGRLELWKSKKNTKPTSRLDITPAITTSTVTLTTTLPPQGGSTAADDITADDIKQAIKNLKPLAEYDDDIKQEIEILKARLKELRKAKKKNS
jgi:hypothetical protein